MRLITTLLISSALICMAAAKTPPARVDPEMLMNKEWIGARGDYLLITKDTAIVHADGFFHERNQWKLNKDTLVLSDRTWGSDKKEHVYEEAFIVERLVADTLVLRSAHDPAGRSTGMGYPSLTNGRSRVFVDHKKLLLPQFRFQKLFYSCGGVLVLVMGCRSVSTLPERLSMPANPGG